MDESENKEKSVGAAAVDVAKDAAVVAKNAAKSLAGVAGKAFGAAKDMGPSSFFSFDKPYFPHIARPVFIVICVVAAIGAIGGVLSGFAGIFTSGVFTGIYKMIASLVCGGLTIILTRFAFEFMMVAFKISKHIDKIDGTETKK